MPVHRLRLAMWLLLEGLSKSLADICARQSACLIVHVHVPSSASSPGCRMLVMLLLQATIICFLT